MTDEPLTWLGWSLNPKEYGEFEEIRVLHTPNRTRWVLGIDCLGHYPDTSHEFASLDDLKRFLGIDLTKELPISAVNPKHLAMLARMQPTPPPQDPLDCPQCGRKVDPIDLVSDGGRGICGDCGFIQDGFDATPDYWDVGEV